MPHRCRYVATRQWTKVSHARTPWALCRQAPLTSPTQDLDTDKSFKLARKHRNTLLSFSKFARRCRFWRFHWRVLSKQTRRLSIPITAAGAKTQLHPAMFHPQHFHGISSQIVHLHFLFHALSLTHTPSTPHLWPSFLSPPSLNSLSFQISLTSCQPTRVQPTQSVAVYPTLLLFTPTHIRGVGLRPYSSPPLGCVAWKQISTHVSLCRSCQHVPDRPPTVIQSLFSGTERCRLHRHGTVSCLPADTRYQRRG